MNAKHTRYREVKANDDTGRWEVFQHDVDGSRCWLATFESESWAYEFAAAPDLLEALESLVKWMDDSGLSTTKPGGYGPFRYEGTEYSVVTDARAALAKAKGE